jgi:hypothetical protein
MGVLPGIPAAVGIGTPLGIAVSGNGEGVGVPGMRPDIATLGSLGAGNGRGDGAAMSGNGRGGGGGGAMAGVIASFWRRSSSKSNRGLKSAIWLFLTKFTDEDRRQNS